MQLLTHFWAEVRHVPGFDDDGKLGIWTQPDKPRAIRPNEGINGHKGTWTTLHPVYWDPDDDLDAPGGTTVESRAEALRSLFADWLKAEALAIGDRSDNSTSAWEALVDQAKARAESMGLPWEGRFVPVSVVRWLMAHGSEHRKEEWAALLETSRAAAWGCGSGGH
jgi:hypothetical protein